MHGQNFIRNRKNVFVTTTWNNSRFFKKGIKYSLNSGTVLRLGRKKKKHPIRQYQKSKYKSKKNRQIWKFLYSRVSRNHWTRLPFLPFFLLKLSYERESTQKSRKAKRKNGDFRSQRSFSLETVHLRSVKRFKSPVLCRIYNSYFGNLTLFFFLNCWHRHMGNVSFWWEFNRCLYSQRWHQILLHFSFALIIRYRISAPFGM